MARLVQSERDYRIARVHELLGSGMSVKAVARSLGIPPASVRAYRSKALPDVVPVVPTVSTSDVLAHATELKLRYPWRGALQIRAMLQQHYESPVPSESLIDAHLKSLGLTRSAKRYGAGGRPYWTQSLPSSPLDMFQIDTVKFTTRLGLTVEYLTCKDVASGFAMALPLVSWQSDALVSLFARIFATMGVPRCIQFDNGLGFVLPRRGALGRLHRYLAGRGVSQILFIPEAEPQRNGSIESFHNWIKREWSHDSAGVTTESDIAEWVADRMTYYNHVKPHAGLGGKGHRKTPAMVHPSGDGEIDTSSDSSSIVVSWVRLVLSWGGAIIKNPGRVFLLNESVAGRYVRIDIDYATGRGFVWTHPADQSSQRDSRRVFGRLVRVVPEPVRVGSFSLGDEREGLVRVAVDADLSPIAVDDHAVLQSWRRVLKQAAPSFVPAGFTLVDRGAGRWQLLDASGECLLSDESGALFLEHADELVA